MARSKFDDRTLIPLFHLPTRGGEMFDSQDLKRKRNVVLFFLTRPQPEFFTMIEGALARLREQNAEPVVVWTAPLSGVEAAYRRNRLTFAILSDEKREVFSRFLAAGEGEDVAALFITDRFGDIFFQYLAASSDGLPSFEEIVKSLMFIESQCPECSGGLS